MALIKCLLRGWEISILRVLRLLFQGNSFNCKLFCQTSCHLIAPPASHTYTNTHTHICTHSAHTHMHTHVWMNTHTLMCTQTQHIYTQTHMHKHIIYFHFWKEEESRVSSDHREIILPYSVVQGLPKAQPSYVCTFERTPCSWLWCWTQLHPIFLLSILKKDIFFEWYIFWDFFILPAEFSCLNQRPCS